MSLLELVLGQWLEPSLNATADATATTVDAPPSMTQAEVLAEIRDEALATLLRLVLEMASSEALAVTPMQLKQGQQLVQTMCSNGKQRLHQ